MTEKCPKHGLTHLFGDDRWALPLARQERQQIGRAATVGWEFAILFVGSVLLGWWADKRFGTSPTLTLVGMAFGAFGGFWTLFRTVQRLSREAEQADAEEKKKRSDGDDP